MLINDYIVRKSESEKRVTFWLGKNEKKLPISSIRYKVKIEIQRTELFLASVQGRFRTLLFRKCGSFSS